jgi:cyanophycinase-like exopeptidase
MKGKLIIIGGHEDSEGDQVVLKEVAHHALKDGCLVIVTAATAEPEKTAQEYTAIFKRLGVRNIRTQTKHLTPLAAPDDSALPQCLRDCAHKPPETPSSLDPRGPGAAKLAEL